MPDVSNQLPGLPPQLPGYNGELLSHEIREVINYRPHWMVRNGSGLLWLVALLLLGSTYFIRYPEVIKGTVRLVAPNFAEFKADPKALGKIKKGQKVTIRIDRHPGYLQGTVNAISTSPNPQDSLLIKVNLSQALPTRDDLVAAAEIVTGDIRLLSRITGFLLIL